jgi:hypothetical protein
MDRPVEQVLSDCNRDISGSAADWNLPGIQRQDSLLELCTAMPPA